MVTHRLLWNRSGSEGLRWYVRGIHDDGRLFGDLRFQSDDPSQRKACVLEATLTNADREDFSRLAQSLPFADRLPTSAFAFIAEVDLNGKEQGVFVYNPGDEQRSEEAQTFVRITNLIRPYVESEWKRYS